MLIYDTFSSHFVLGFHKLLHQYLDFMCREQILLILEECVTERQLILITTKQSEQVYLAFLLYYAQSSNASPII